MTTVMCSLSATVYKIFSRNLHDTDLGLYNGQKSNVNIPIESHWMTSYVMTIVLFALPVRVTVCEIIMFNLPKWS